MTIQQKNNAPSQKRLETDALFIIWLILFAVLEVALVVMILINACGAEKGTQPPINDGQTPPTSTVAPQPSDPSTPVFAGGGQVVLPKVSEHTVDLSSIDSKYAILINAQTGEIVAQKNASISFSPASMTKVMTLIVACENLTMEDLDKKIPLTEEIVSYTTSGSYAGTDF